jgi:hypothetical protein
MAAAPSWNDYFVLGKTEAQSVRPDLTFEEGSISEMVTVSGASMADLLTGTAALLAKATYLDGAEGDDLTTLADDHWGIIRQDAVGSTVTVRFTRSNTTATVTIPAGTRVATQKDALGNEIIFVTDDDTNVNAGVATADIPCSCTLGGISGNVAISTVNRVLDTLTPPFTCTNLGAAVGGADQESDDDLRDRVRGYASTLRRGTIAALEFGAKEIAGVAKASAVEDASGLITIYVSDADGNSDAGMVSDVEDELEDWRAAGSVVNVVGATVYDLTGVSITLVVRTGVDTVAIASKVKAAIVARVNKLRIGETCQRAIIQQAALNVDDNITGCTVISPGADVDPADNEVIRTEAAEITVA